MPEDLLTMSAKEVDRAGLIRRVLEGRLMMGLTARQVRRMCRAYERHGPRRLISGKRGKPGNNQRLGSVRADVVALVRERYADFGPTLAAEKLRELHRFFVSKETLRQWMKAEGLGLSELRVLASMISPCRWRHRAVRPSRPTTGAIPSSPAKAVR